MDRLFRAASQRPKFGVAKRLGTAFLLLGGPGLRRRGGRSGILRIVLVDEGDLDLDRLRGGGDRRAGCEGGDLIAGEPLR